MWQGEGVLAIPTEVILRDFGSLQQYRPETAWLVNSSAQMDLGVFPDSKLKMCQELALAIKKADNILGCVSGSTASRSRKVITSLCSACVRLHLEHSLGPQHQKDVDKLQVQQKATVMAWAGAPPP